MGKLKSIVQHQDGDLFMRQRVDDGYINLNDIAKSTGKRVDVWLRIARTKELILEFEKQKKVRAISTEIGRGKGTWAHPDVAKAFTTWCKTRRPTQKEKPIQLRLNKALGGEIEVPASTGFIDILTETELIEVKETKSWINAVGQVIIYGQDYPDHQKRIHLFGSASPSFKSLVKSRCSELDIEVTWEN